MVNLNDIKKYVLKESKKINAPKDIIPTFDNCIDFGHPNIEIDDNKYCFVIVERGQELERKSTDNLEDLYYWIFDSITTNMAFNYEFKNRNPGEDTRRLAFSKQLELLEIIDKKFVNRKNNEIKKILNENPYNDCPQL